MNGIYNRYYAIKLLFIWRTKALKNNINISYNKYQHIDENEQIVERKIYFGVRLKFKLVILNTLTGSIFDGTLYCEAHQNIM